MSFQRIAGTLAVWAAGAALLLGLSSTGQAAIITYTSTNTGSAVPDGTGVDVTFDINIPVTDLYQILAGNAVTVTLHNWSHTWIGDLTLTLTGPGVGPIFLFGRPGVDAGDPLGDQGSDCNFGATSDYTFSSNAAQALPPDSASATCPGGELPAGIYLTLLDDDLTNSNLSSAFAGINIAGTTWTLTADDRAGGDFQPDGWGWSISFDVTPVPEPSYAGAMLVLAGLGVWRLRKR
jgi:hypothetical protein